MNPVILKTAALLALSNCFMTFAWYGHLKGLRNAPWMIAVLTSWGVAFFEYLIMVPANRIGYAGGLELGQLKIMQEVITLYHLAGLGNGVRAALHGRKMALGLSLGVLLPRRRGVFRLPREGGVSARERLIISRVCATLRAIPSKEPITLL